MSKYVFDIETNGLYPTEIWMLVLQDVATKEIFSYSDHTDKVPSMDEGLNRLSNAKVIAGHNILGFDLPIMKRLLGWEPTETTRVWDTFIMSQLCKYQRPHMHGLAGWGKFFDFAKGDYGEGDDAWNSYNDQMLAYCIRDVELNTMVYERVSKEASILMKQEPMFLQALQLEHDFAMVNAEITTNGWKFDMERAEALESEILDRMEYIEEQINPQLGKVAVMRGNREVDRLVKKNGDYYKSVVDWFELAEDIKASNGDISGPYTRVEFNDVQLGQLDHVKKFLLDKGWKPDDYTVKKINGAWIKQSPKLTESSLKPLGTLGSYIGDYYMLRNRLATVEGWVAAVRDESGFNDGRLHGSMFGIGTPSFRCRHPNIAQVPAVYAPYGKELRTLLTCEKGMKVIGADSAGNQFRGLCHYIGDDGFTSKVVSGDIHQLNADILGITRPQAKTFIYAYLFGAGPAKLGEAITGKKSAKVGKQADERFRTTLPGLQALKDKLSDEFRMTNMKTGQPFIQGADGRRVLVGSEHQTLNYLLQSLEGITCKAAIVYASKKIKALGLTAYPTLFYHDEMVFIAKESDAEAVKEICVEAFREAPKSVGVMCMDGDGQIGDSYADVH